MSVFVGATIALECSVTNRQSTELHWLRDNKPFAYLTYANEEDQASQWENYEYSDDPSGTGGSFRSRHKVAASGALQIFNARILDSGKYTCLASNSHGQAKVDAYLTVTGLYWL